MNFFMDKKAINEAPKIDTFFSKINFFQPKWLVFRYSEQYSINYLLEIGLKLKKVKPVFLNTGKNFRSIETSFESRLKGL